MSNVFDNPIASDPYEAISQGGQIQYLVKKSSYGKLRALTQTSFVQSTSSTSQVFASANTMITFLLPIGLSNQQDILERMVLQLSITNNDGAHVASLLPIAFMINRLTHSL
jgi:hypothetical protein